MVVFVNCLDWFGSSMFIKVLVVLLVVYVLLLFVCVVVFEVFDIKCEDLGLDVVFVNVKFLMVLFKVMVVV